MAKQLYQSEAKLAGVLLDSLSAESSTASIRIRWFDSDDKATARTPHASTLKFTIDPENTQGKKTEFFKCVSHSTNSGITTHSTNTRGLQRDQTTDLSGSATRAQSWDAGTPVAVTTEPHNMNLVKEYFEGAEPVPGNMEFDGDIQFDGSNTYNGTQNFNGPLNISGASSYLKFPNLTTAERDALTPSNGMGIYNTTTGTYQLYDGGAWTDVDQGTVTANSSEAVTGIVQLNTAAQTTAATDTDGGDPTVNKPSETAKVIQKSSYVYAASTTGNDTYAASFTPTLPSVTDGMRVLVKVDTANTGACSLNGVAIKTKAGSDPATGDIPANSIMDLVYNSTGPKWELQGSYGNAPITNAALTDGSDAGGLHYHQSKVGMQNSAWTPGAVSQTNSKAHGLGRTPKKARVYWGTSEASSANVPFGFLLWDGTNTVALNYKTTANPGNSFEVGSEGDVDDNPTSGSDWRFTVSCDATNITLTVSAYSSNKGIFWIFEVE